MVDIKSCLDKNQARKLLGEILSNGTWRFSRHAEDEMAKDNLIKNDILNVLRGGHIYESGEFLHASWRYRVHTDNIGVVIAFDSDSSITVVTAWRKRP